MRFPSIETDFWELGSGEEYHRDDPETFHLPSRQEREGLKVNDSAKLIFHIEGEDDAGAATVEGERMWVLVTEVNDGHYIGLLANEPLLFEPTDDFYLCERAEIPFTAEHIIAIDRPSVDDTRAFVALGAARVWPRDDDPVILIAPPN